MNILKVYKDAFLSKQRYIVIKGGSGSGKSVFIAQKIISRIVSEENLNILVVRKVASTVKNSVYQLLKDIIRNEGLADFFIFNKSDYSFIYTPNGNRIITTGTDDVNKLKSITGIGSVWLEEATEFFEDDLTQIILRVRGKSENVKQFYITFNPVSELHFLKKKFFDVIDPDIYTLTTTYKDNPFLDDDYIKYLTDTLRSNPNMFKIYSEGIWGQISTGGELVKAFNYTKHVFENVLYNPELALHISYDFNVLPGVSIIISQITNKEINVIDEIQLTHPHNNTRCASVEFLKRYLNHTSGLFIYGDSSGKNESSRSEAGFNEYTIIMKELNKFKPSLRLLTKNPSVVMGNNFLNDILLQNSEDIIIRINTKCKKFIDDLLYGKEAADGGKLIEYAKTESGAKYEKYFHMYDAFKYFLIKSFHSEYTKYQSAGTKPRLNSLRNRDRNNY